MSPKLGGRKLHPGLKARWRFKLALVNACLEQASCSESRGQRPTSCPWLGRFGASGDRIERAPECHYCL